MKALLSAGRCRRDPLREYGGKCAEVRGGWNEGCDERFPVSRRLPPPAKSEDGRKESGHEDHDLWVCFRSHLVFTGAKGSAVPSERRGRTRRIHRLPARGGRSRRNRRLQG